MAEDKSMKEIRKRIDTHEKQVKMSAKGGSGRGGGGDGGQMVKRLAVLENRMDASVPQQNKVNQTAHDEIQRLGKRIAQIEKRLDALEKGR